MDFDFSDDQLQLRDAVQKWVTKGYSFERRRGIARAGGFSREVYGELAELGLCGLFVPQEHGGLGMGPVEAMVVMEELGRGIVLEPLTQTLIAAAILDAYAPAQPATQHLAKIATGDSLVVLAYLERQGRYRLEPCQTSATAVHGGWSVHGTKSIVSAGDQANAFIVSASIEGATGLFLVPNNGHGVTARGYGTLDGSRAAEVSFDNCPAELITTHGLNALQHALDIGIAATCAEAVGVMDQTLAITVDYMNTRKQFGVVLGSFQALRHRAADMKMRLELARSMSYYASLKLNQPAPERRAAMARAKVQLGNSMRLVGQEAIQLHGGIGVTDDYVVSHYFKRLTQMEMSFGDTLHHLAQVSEQMQDQAGAFT